MGQAPRIPGPLTPPRSTRTQEVSRRRTSEGPSWPIPEQPPPPARLPAKADEGEQAEAGGAKRRTRKSPVKRTSATSAAKTPAAKTPAAKRSEVKETAASRAAPAQRTTRPPASSSPPATELDATVALRPLRMPDPRSVQRPWLRSYPLGVPETYDYPLVPLTRFLDDAAADFPETTAVEFGGLELSYQQLLDQVDRLAAAFQSLRLTRGRIAIMLPNCPQHLIAMFAALRIGATVVEVDPLQDTEDLGRQLAETAVQAIVFLDPYFPKLDQLKGRLPALERLIATGIQDYLKFPRNLLFPLTGWRSGSYARIPSSEGVLRLADLVKRSAPVFIQVEVDPVRDVAAILFTSGAGERKPVCLTHVNLVVNAFQGRLWIPDVQAGRERLLCAVPFSDAFGFTMCVTAGVLSAGTFVIVPKTDAQTVVQAIETQRPTLFPAHPSLYQEIVHCTDAPRRDLSSLRACLSGGGALAPIVAVRFEELTGGKVRSSYGLAEAGPLTHANPMYGPAKPGSIGLPVTDTVCAVMDRRNPTQLVRPGQEGELAVSGPQVMKGYCNRPSETTAVLRDRWLLTGDIVVMDEDGYFHLVERRQDAIKACGVQVVPRAVEAVLSRHPKVAKAAVAGIPELRGGEVVKAYIVLREGQTATVDEMDDYCRRELAVHEVPQRYEFRAFLPQTPPGRPMREALIAEELAD
ncbi:MAG: AMP-binding protein [Egibacteraceae bacterium]